MLDLLNAAQSAADQQAAEYIDDLWFLLHHSEADERLMLMGLTAYLDDSEAGDSASIVTIGGPLFSRIQHKEFSARWGATLLKYRIPQPFHMTNFVRPHGTHIGMFPEMKLALFRDLARLINSHKYYSLSISVAQADFRNLLSPEVCKAVIGPYALAFWCAVLLNRGVERIRNDGNTVSFLVDEGCAHPDQLRTTYGVVRNMEKRFGERYTGALAFDTDDRVPALQAADLVSWSARRREVFGALRDEYEPLNEVLREDWPLHQHLLIPLEAIEMVARPINNWIAHNGAMPVVSEIIKR
jgi:hypothetical protein